MSVIVKINDVDVSDQIDWESLNVTQNLTSQVDTANIRTKKYGDKTLVPEFNDDLKIYDGATQIFGGTILKVKEYPESGGGGVVYEAEASDYTYELDKQLASKTYEDQTIKEIVDDLIASYASGFTDANVESEFVIDKIVFNQVPISQCLKKLADIVRYDWYVDENKDIHFFSKFTNAAPYGLTDTSGNYVYKTLERTIDGSQVVNRVKVRGGEYDGETYTDVITVSGNDTKSFKLPYKMSDLSIEVDTGAGYVSKTVGVDFIDDFTSKDVLHNYQDQSFRFENALANGNKIQFSGKPKVRVFAVAEDAASIATYGRIEKLIRDNSIKDNAVARRRAAAELYAYANSIVDAKFYTYDSGLRAGMVINLSSTRRDCDDDLIIKTINFRMIDPSTFGYYVQLVSTKRYGLIELLQKILEPEPLDIDEVEVSEEIYTDAAEVVITEEIEMVTPETADEDITISENILKDPVDPGDIRFVLAPYTPTGQDDTKRMGRLNISMKVY